MSNSFNQKCYVFIRLSLNLVRLWNMSSRSWICLLFCFEQKFYVLVWLSLNLVGCEIHKVGHEYTTILTLHIFKGGNQHVSWFNKNFNVGFFTQTCLREFCQALCAYYLAWGLPVYTRFDDLDLFQDVSYARIINTIFVQFVVHCSLNVV